MEFQWGGGGGGGSDYHLLEDYRSVVLHAQSDIALSAMTQPDSFPFLNSDSI